MISYILGEIIRPFIYGLGWLVVWIFTFGHIKPTKENFFKYLIVGVIGVYTGCALPVLVVIPLRYLGVDV